MAAVKYAPPAIPPRKKYQTIIISQLGILSIAASLPAVAEREQRAEPDEDRRADGQERVRDDVPLRELRAVRQVVGAGLRQEQEERVQAAEEALRVGAVELRVLEAHPLERLDALLRLGLQLVPEPELDRLRRARLRTGRAEPVVDAVVAERALLRRAGGLVEGHDAEGAGGDAVAAAVARVLVDVHRPVLGPVDGARRTRLETARLGAVLADVRHEEPRQLARRPRLLDEAHEAEGLVREVRLVLVGAGPLRHLHAQLVPLLARDLAGAAADTEGGVREHRQRAGHGYTTPFFTLQRKALDSWMKTLGSPTLAERSLVMSPLLPGRPGTPL